MVSEACTKNAAIPICVHSTVNHPYLVILSVAKDPENAGSTHKNMPSNTCFSWPISFWVLRRHAPQDDTAFENAWSLPYKNLKNPATP